MDNKEILESSAFKVLNHMIDEKAEQIVAYLPYIQEEVNRIYNDKSGNILTYLQTRTYEEGDDTVNIPVALHQLKRIGEIIDDLLKAEEEIRALQRQKLRLLNDYDFTKGDDTEQKKIFG
jgi:hypothetical protein